MPKKKINEWLDGSILDVIFKVFSIFGIIILGIYACDTRQMREVSQKQLIFSQRPFLAVSEDPIGYFPLFLSKEEGGEYGQMKDDILTPAAAVHKIADIWNEENTNNWYAQIANASNNPALSAFAIIRKNGNYFTSSEENLYIGIAPKEKIIFQGFESVDSGDIKNNFPEAEKIIKYTNINDGNLFIIIYTDINNNYLYTIYSNPRDKGYESGETGYINDLK